MEFSRMTKYLTYPLHMFPGGLFLGHLHKMAVRRILNQSLNQSFHTLFCTLFESKNFMKLQVCLNCEHEIFFFLFIYFENYLIEKWSNYTIIFSSKSRETKNLYKCFKIDLYFLNSTVRNFSWTFKKPL